MLNYFEQKLQLLIRPRHFFHYENRPGTRHYVIVLAEQVRAQAEEDEAAGQELRLLPHATPEGACTERKNIIQFSLILYQKDRYTVHISYIWYYLVLFAYK